MSEEENFERQINFGRKLVASAFLSGWVAAKTETMPNFEEYELNEAQAHLFAERFLEEHHEAFSRAVDFILASEILQEGMER